MGSSGINAVNQGPMMGVTTPEEQKSKVDDKMLEKEKEKQQKSLALEEKRKQKEMKAQMKKKKDESKTEMKRKNDEMQTILKKRWLNQEEMKAAKNSEGTRTDTEHIDSPETLARPESILKTEDSAIEIENTENINPFLMEFAESVSSDIIKEAKAQNIQEEDIDEEIEHQTEQETIIINAANNSSKVEGSSIGIDVSENDGLQTGSTTIMSGSDVEKILRIIKETDEEFKEKEKQILDEFERRRKEENIKEMEKELKKQKREQERLRKENEKTQKKRDKMEKEEQKKKEKEELANKKKIEAKMKKEHEAEIRRLETDAKQNGTNEVDSRDKTIIDKEKQLAIEKEMSQYRITPDIDKKSKYDTGNKKLGEVEAEIQLEEAGNPFEEYESSKKL